MIKEIKLSEKQFSKLIELQNNCVALEKELRTTRQRQQDIIELIAEHEKIVNIENVELKDNVLVFNINDKKK